MPDLNGVLLVDKPEGPTSHDMVALARRVLGVRRIGHAGTLDPLATGLLVLMVGKATRLASLLSGVDKTYRGILRLGLATDTYDRAGTPIGSPVEVKVTHDDLMAHVERFRGTIMQVSPVYSAKKVRGTPMYRLARRRKPVAPTTHSVTFRRIEVLGFSGTDVEILAEVSAGTYLRSFAHDLGQELGCGGHLHSLRRTAAGLFRVEEAIPPEELKAMGAEARDRLIPLRDVPLGIPTLRLTAAAARAVLHGRQCPLSEVLQPRPPIPTGRCRLEGPERAFLGIGEVVPQARPIIKPQIVFPP